MKVFLKFSLLLALIVVGKLAKQPAPPALALAPAPTARFVPITEVVLVHQVLTSEPVLCQPPALGPYGYLRATDTMRFDSF